MFTRLNFCKRSKSGVLALKLDFSARWVKLVLACVTALTFSFLTNGTVRGWVYPKRGIRQGCPLSPYLFILCFEVFLLYYLQLRFLNTFVGFDLHMI